MSAPTTPTIPTTSAPRPAVARIARALVLKQLRGLQDARLEILDADGVAAFGPATATLRAQVHVHDPRLWTRILARGALGAGEAYGEGYWTADDLTAALRAFVRNRTLLDGLDRGVASLSRSLLRGILGLSGHSRERSRKDIAFHYDLGNAFFELFLDETMTYSCAVFDGPDTSLAEASVAKLDRMCRKLDLQPGHRVLEIGCGWGSFAEHAAKHYGCEVVGTTISAEQYAYATERIRRAGLDDRVSIVRQDYRDLGGRFDRIVSIEMIEAVGHDNLATYFGVIEERLAPGGKAAIQAITIDGARYEAARRTMDFIKRHIFPGSFIPSVDVMRRSAAGAGLAMHAVDEIGLDYAETLSRWRARFAERGNELEALGFDARFRRYWDYYFAYCEAGFLERQLGNVQFVLSRPEEV